MQRAYEQTNMETIIATSTQQGGSSSSVTVVTHPRFEQPGKRPWSSGLCACFNDIGSCCFGFWCLSCLACDVSTKLNESFCLPCCVYGGILALRTKLRTLYNIEGSIMCDSCILCCCAPCAICQMDRELTYVGL